MTKSQIPVTYDDIDPHKGVVSQLMHEPMAIPGFENPGAKAPSFGDAMFNIGGSDFPMEETVNSVTLAVVTGMRLGIELAARFETRVGLKELEARKAANQLGADEARFLGLKGTSAAIAVYVAARYTLWKVSSIREDEVRSVTVGELPKLAISYTGRQAALRGLLSHLGEIIGGEGVSVLYVPAAFCQALTKIMEDLAGRAASLPEFERFSDVSYRLEGTEFVVDGFDPSVGKRLVTTEITPIKAQDIVGNHEAKHLARRISRMLALYNFERKRNPFCDVGLFQRIIMVFGTPGTGKTLLIRLIATELRELCEARGVPFRADLMKAIIDSYQGRSAQNTQTWLGGLSDKTIISLLGIDDAENTLLDRSDKSSSEGSKGVVQAFLTGTEGAGSEVHGGSLLLIATNVPDMLDPAVRSRVNVNMELKGARGQHDVLDQHMLGLKSLAKLMPEPFGVQEIGGYTLFSDQTTGREVHSKSVGPYGEPQQGMTREAYQAALRQVEGKKGHPLLLPATLFAEFQTLNPRASSRDIRNLQTAVFARYADFDIPDETYEKPELFLAQPYDRQVEILREMARAAVGGLDFGEVMLEETVRYLDAFAQIEGAQFEREVKATRHDLKVRQEAFRLEGIKA